MSDFFHANPFVARYVHAAPDSATSKRGYDIVDQTGQRLAYAYEDLGAGGGQRLWNDVAQAMTNSCRFVVDDPHQQRLLALQEQRGRRRSTVSVAWSTGQHLGTITMERRKGTARNYRLSDTHGRLWGQLIRHDPQPGRSVLGRLVAHNPQQGRMYTATDHEGTEVARITDTKRQDTSLGYETRVSDHMLQLRYPQLPEPLSTLLRAATIAVDFAEFSGS